MSNCIIYLFILPLLMDPSAACGDMVVTLQPISRLGERQNIQLSSSSEVLSFSFSKVLPGKYKGKMKAKGNQNGVGISGQGCSNVMV